MSKSSIRREHSVMVVCRNLNGLSYRNVNADVLRIIKVKRIENPTVVNHFFKNKMEFNRV